MLNFLIFLSLLLTGVIFYLNYRFYMDRRKFNSRIKTLEDFILQINKQHAIQNNQLQLSDDMREKIKSVNTALSNDIFDLNHEMFEILSRNNLLNK
ncbi:hypothetical protein [Flavobacterium sp. 3HN19-14]|uniref:hypothetical protein n=1 Tax=Flavobacterium sp. 3HN19-14 TaxID=3448133 RepID=UPI003EDF2673